MKLLSIWLVLGLAVLATCACTKKEITPLQRKQAANLVSEAQFAATMRDYARAESLLAQATQAAPDTGVFWISLGSMRVKLNQRGAARDAYKQALAAFEAEAKAKKDDADPALQHVYVLALLGRVDDARRLQDKLPARYPNDRDVRAFVEGKRLDQLLNSPGFKQAAL